MMREKMVHSHDHAESQMNVAKYAEGGGGNSIRPPPPSCATVNLDSQ